ncbi:MAG: DUF4097 family beta strand repeat-containing protein [Cyclonatronaceae bacterium]
MDNVALRTVFAAALLGAAFFMNLKTADSAMVADTGVNVQSDDPYRTELFSVSGQARIISSTSGGNITVSGQPGNEVKVEMFVRQRGRNLTPSDTDLDDFEITIEQDGDEITASARRKSSVGGWFGGSSSQSISFVIHAPGNSDTDLRTSGGNVSVASLNGAQKMRTSGGNLSISDINGSTEAGTSGGNIRVTNHEGALDIQTSGGNLSIVNQAGEVTARTSGGRINLESVAGKISARTSGGSISAEITEAIDLIDLQTSGGNIDVTLPAGAGLTLNVRGSRVSSELDGLKGTVSSGKIEGTVGDGAVEVNIRTSGGSVRLKQK